jgi:hypothetical protein
MSVQDPELSAETPYSEHFMAPAAGDPDAVLAELKAIHHEMKRRSSEVRIVTTPLNGVGDGAGFCVMTLPIVPQGFRQRVLDVVVGGVTFQATAKGNCVVFVSGAQPQIDIAVPTSWVRAYLSALPGTALFNEYQLLVRQGSFLGLQIYDSTFAADQYVANITSIFEPETADLFHTGGGGLGHP